MPPLSVTAIIPTYNRASYIGECIDSILVQSHPVDEIIIINDGSTDNTLEVLKHYNDPRIKIFTQDNRGKSAALNFAIAQSTKDLIWICDDDDYACPSGLQALITAFQKNEDADMTFGKMLFFYDRDKNQSKLDLNYPLRSEEPSAKINFLERMVTNQFAMLIKRSVYMKVGPFREDLIRAQDIEMALRITRHFKAISVPEYIFCYRIHSGSRGSAADNFNSKENAKKWRQYAEMFYREIRQTYDLSEFCPSFALKWEKPLAQRAQLLERALVFANQSMWADALEDLEAATQADTRAVTQEEIKIARSVIINDLPWQTLIGDQNLISKLRFLTKSTTYGQAIVFALCYRIFRFSARQAIKKHKPREAFKMLCLIISILRPSVISGRGSS